MSRDSIAQVATDVKIDKLLSYLAPKDFGISIGDKVEIPLKGKMCEGIVIDLKEDDSSIPLKKISRVVQPKILSMDLLKMAFWMSSYYRTPLRKVLKTLLPAAVRQNKKEKEQFFVTRLKTIEELTLECARLRNLKPPQASVLDVMINTKKGIFLSELMEKAGVSRSPIETLAKNKYLKIDIVRVNRSPLIDEEYFKTKAKHLIPEQKEALDKIVKTLEKKEFAVHLLHGVTGSGKTEIYLQAMEAAIESKKGALMLVPEISLTEQTIERFRSRFDSRIAVLHHRLSEGERLDEWRRIKEGEAPIVIGARSAVFSPIPNLSLIIIDEEHESSYKQSDEAPRYHARECAIMRAKILNASVVLGSATPSLESYYNALNGKYILSALNTRADSQNLPSISIVNMKREHEKSGGFTLFSEPLLDGIKKRMEIGEQTILFLNRRGYHTLLKCLPCGEAVKCPHCDTTLSFHKKENELSCHLCGYASPTLTSCPSCKSPNPLKFKGFGTELVESSLKAIFPDIRTLRMDRDTTKHKGSHSRLFRDFGRGKADVLIGTQMIAKGLHFSEVTLVGVINCEGSLQVPDFRSSENTFQLLVQVAGRAGRTRAGEVIFQTLLDDNSTIQLAAKQDYKGFYEEEIAVRKAFSYPPFSALAKIAASSLSEKKAFETLARFRTDISGYLPGDYDIHPITPSGHAKVKDRYRFHFLIRGPSSQLISKALEKIQCPEDPEVKIGIDINPSSTFF